MAWLYIVRTYIRYEVMFVFMGNGKERRQACKRRFGALGLEESKGNAYCLMRG
jgi:hypothetical protein